MCNRKLQIYSRKYICTNKRSFRKSNSVLEKTKSHVGVKAEMQLIVGGDFNTQLNPDTDKKGGHIEYQTQCTKLIESSMDEYNLVNIWRLRNLNKRKFTRREKAWAGLVQS